jgi:hypothetical protein
VRLKFTNRGALFVTNFYIIYGQTLKLFFQECEGTDIIFDNNFLFSKLFSFMIFCMEMYMELQLYLPFFIYKWCFDGIFDVLSNQPHDENAMPPYVEHEYYCHDLFKPSKVSPFHVVFDLKGSLTR